MDGRRELFIQAVKTANIPEIEAQLGADPDVNYYIYTDDGMLTPLIAAIEFIPEEQTALQVINILLKVGGADVNMRKEYHFIDTFPLSLALKQGYYNVARTLFKYVDLRPRYLQCSYFYTAASPPLDLISDFAQIYAGGPSEINPRIVNKRLFTEDVAEAAAYGQNDILQILPRSFKKDYITLVFLV